jgi:uncharacterized protein
MRRSVRILIAVGLAAGACGVSTAVALTIRDVEAVLHPERRAIADTPSPWPRVQVQLTTEDGVSLGAWYLPSRNGAAVIMAHGHGENRLQLLPETEALAARGFGVLLFDWRAHGESGGELTTRGDRERLDLRAAVDWLSSQRDLGSGRVGVLGFSRGATVAIEVAARDERVAAVVAEAAVTSLQDALELDFSRFGALSVAAARLSMKAHGIDVDSVKPIAHIRAIAPRPVMIVQGTADESVPLHMGKLLYAAAGDPKHLWLIPGAGHGGYRRQVGPEYTEKVVDFFETALLGTR